MDEEKEGLASSVRNEIFVTGGGVVVQQGGSAKHTGQQLLVWSLLQTASDTRTSGYKKVRVGAGNHHICTSHGSPNIQHAYLFKNIRT